jgi:hypothetical protein
MLRSYLALSLPKRRSSLFLTFILPLLLEFPWREISQQFEEIIPLFLEPERNFSSRGLFFYTIGNMPDIWDSEATL